MAELVVTFLGAVQNLDAEYIADRFKIVGGGLSDKDSENAGLVLWFLNFTGDKKQSEDLTKDVARHLDNTKKAEGLSFRFVGAFRREGESYIKGNLADRDGYAIAVTPKAAP